MLDWEMSVLLHQIKKKWDIKYSKKGYVTSGKWNLCVSYYTKWVSQTRQTHAHGNICTKSWGDIKG